MTDPASITTLATLTPLGALAPVVAQAGFPEPMHALTMMHYLVLSAALFGIGLIGFISRRNLIIMFLCTEIMFQAAGIALVAFGRFHLNHTGETFVIFVLTVAAAEAALALALIVLLFRTRTTLDASAWSELSG